MSLTIVESIQQGWVVVTVSGEVDIYTTPLLRSHLLVALASAAEPAACVRRLYGMVLVLAEVPFMDSSGLGALLVTYKRAQALGMAVRLASVGSQVATLLRVTGLDKVMDVRPSVEAATATA